MPHSHRYPTGVNPYAPSSSISATGARSLPPRPGGGPHTLRHAASSGNLRGAAGGSSAGGAGQTMLLDDVDIEDFPPPDWRTILNRRADMGYPDYYPSRPGFDQPEDVLTEDNVKNGFTARAFVAAGAEVFSMHGPIYQHLSGGGINVLTQLGQEIIEKRQESMPQIGERTFRIPVRVTYNDVKRSQFLMDLANPKVPLHRLMRTPVPHGFKGVELLDTMFSPASGTGTGGHSRATSGSASAKIPAVPIPLERALWFIRVLGANEITAHRSRTQPTTAVNVNVSTPVQVPSPTAAATPSSTTTVAATAPTLPVSSDDWYTQEFTNTFISWLRIQLGHLVLPNANKAVAVKPGVAAPKAGSGVLSDENARTRWLAKWDYSTHLLRELHAQQLISTRLFTGWLADFLGHSNLAQLGFIAQLVGAYLSDVSNHLANARHCVRAACEKLKEIKASPAAATLTKVEAMLLSIINTLYESDSSVILSPTTWRNHSELLSGIVATTTSAWHHVRQRNERLLFKPASSEGSSSPRRQQMEEIQKLDSICDDTDMLERCRSYFDGGASPTAATLDTAKLQEKIFILLNWAMGLFQLGSHRPYAVYTMLKHWQEQYEKFQAKQTRSQTIDLFDILYRWLDHSEFARKEDNAQAIGLTFGELTRQGLWSYGRYLQTLIAKGQTARNQAPGVPRSHHLTLLRVMPIFVDAKDLLQQRRIAICGDDAELRQRDAAEEERILDAFRDEVQEYIPEIFGYKRYGRSASLKDQIDYQPPSIHMMNRFLYVYARFWLAPMATARLKRQGRTPPMDASTFARVIKVFRLSRGFATIADFIDRALQDSDDDEILEVIIDCVKRDADVWTAMDRWPRLGDKLLHRYEALEKEARHHHHPRLLEALYGLAHQGRLTTDDEEIVKDLWAERESARSNEPTGGRLDLKDSIPLLQQTLTAGKSDEAVSMAPRLFSRHDAFSAWGSAWWTMLVEVLQRSNAEKLEKSALASAVVAHMVAIDIEKPDSINTVTSAWLDSLAPQALIDFFGKRSSGSVVLVLLEIVARRRLSTVTLLEKAIYPIWKHTSLICVTPRRHLNSKQIHAVAATVNMACQLLVYPPLDDALPPNNLAQSLVLLSARQAAFTGINVQNLIRHLPLLVVLERSSILSDTTNVQIASMLRSLAMTAEFKTAAFRNLNMLKDAFLSTEWSKPALETDLEAGMVETLKLIMAEKPSSSPKSQNGLPTFEKPARLSAWRWTRIVLEMRVEFKRLATRIAEGDDIVEARQTLNRLVHATLGRESTVDDTDLLCEAFRGMDIVVTQEILAAGLDRLTSLLGHAIGAETQHELDSQSRTMDHILRIIDSTSNQHHSSAPTSDSAVLIARHKLIELLSVALQSIERHLLPTPAQSPGTDLMLHHDISPPQAGDLLRVVLNLLKFTLGVAVTDSTSPTMPKPNFLHLAVCFFKVLIASHHISDSETAEMLSDVLAYIVDCTPPQSRLALQTALLGETTSPAVQSVLAISPHIASSLPYLAPVRRNMTLSIPGAGEDGLADAGLPLDERKWELFEQMAPVPKQKQHQNQYLGSAPLTDTASIPVALFGPKMTRDAVAMRQNSSSDSDSAENDDSGEDEGEYPWERLASERDLGDGLGGEPTYVRQKATYLYAPGPVNDMDDLTRTDDSLVTRNQGPGGSLHADSPGSASAASFAAYTHPRRMSTRLANVSSGSGGGKAGGSGSHKDPIALDSDEEDDDSEVNVAPPASKRPKTASKSTTRQTTGGKAPPSTTSRKTTGGKAPARKTVAGKSTRGTSSKAPRGARRKSGAGID